MQEEKKEGFESYEGPASLSPLPLSVSSPSIKPEDRRLIQANAVESMHVHANEQIDMLKKQAELIMKQAREVEERVRISEQIYQSEMRFSPKILGIYHLYEKKDGVKILSMVAPKEWGKSMPWKRHIATVKLLGDHTWDVLEYHQEEEA